MQIRLERGGPTAAGNFLRIMMQGELTSRTFGMFGGREVTICLEAHNRSGRGGAGSVWQGHYDTQEGS